MSLISKIENPTNPLSIYFENNYKKLSQFLINESKVIEKNITLFPYNNHNDSNVSNMVKYLFKISMGEKVESLSPMKLLEKANSIPAKNPFNYALKAFHYLPESHSSRFFEQCNALYSLSMIEANFINENTLLIPNKSVPEDVINDMINIWDNSLLRNKYYNSLDKILYNPQFSLSHEVGETNIDFIKFNKDKKVGNCLVKMDMTTDNLIDNNSIYELLSCIFLDKLNYFKIKEIALYLPRKKFQYNWKLEDVILCGSDFKSVRKAKASFMDALKQLPASAAMKNIISSLE